MSIANGWLLRVSNASIPVIVIFIIFPLTYLIYKLIKNQLLLKITLLTSWLVIAFVIGNMNLSGNTITETILYTVNALFFVVLLLNVFSNTGYLFLFIFAIASFLLFQITDWERSLRLIWYCNFMLSANNTGMCLSQHVQSFPKAMILMSIIAFFSILLGWTLVR